MQTKTENKQGRGRPKDYTPYAEVTAEDLKNILQKCESVPIPKKWLRTMNIDVSSLGDAKIQNPVKEEEKIEFTIEK